MASSPPQPAPALAIGICTFNRGPKIARTLNAVAAMDRAGGRVSRLIVIDNNCTDQTAPTVDAFAASAPALPIERVLEPVQGLTAARRRFVLHTTEPYLAFLDDDCLPDPAWAASILRALDSQPRAGAIGGRVRLHWESGPTAHALRCATMLAQQDLGPVPIRLDHPERCLVGAAIGLRRQAVIESGWLDSRRLSDRAGVALTSGGDHELCIRIRRAGWDLHYEPAAIVEHLIPPERQTDEYLTRLARGVSLSKAELKWLAHGEPGLDWVRAHASKARRRRLRSLLLEWRPRVRARKLAEHSGRCEGWESLVRRLEQT